MFYANSALNLIDNCYPSNNYTPDSPEAKIAFKDIKDRNGTSGIYRVHGAPAHLPLSKDINPTEEIVGSYKTLIPAGYYYEWYVIRIMPMKVNPVKEE